MGKIWNDGGEAGRVLTAKTKGGNEAALYVVDQAGILNLAPKVKYVVRCIEHNKCAGFAGQRPARNAVRHSNLYCTGCGWDSSERADGVIEDWGDGIEWSEISGRTPKPIHPTTDTQRAVPLKVRTISYATVVSSAPIPHPGWDEASVPRMDRAPVKCDNCGVETRKRWAVQDGHKWQFNGAPVDGPIVRPYCSVRCAKSAHPDRIKKEWVANEISGGRTR